MAKYSGKIGFVLSTPVETAPGVFENPITERKYRGDVLQDSRRWDKSEYANDDLNLANRISIVGDAYAHDNFFAIRYVEWMGALWKVTKVEIQRPRLILTIGGVYNGR
jgi:hypothetical protein